MTVVEQGWYTLQDTFKLLFYVYVSRLFWPTYFLICGQVYILCFVLYRSLMIQIYIRVLYDRQTDRQTDTLLIPKDIWVFNSLYNIKSSLKFLKFLCGT